MQTREKVLNITAEGKGIILYGKITASNSLYSAPENGFFFEKSQFYSDLKQKVASDEEYENWKFLYLTLKMRNLSGMNDLYVAQDVIILCEIVENRFELMYSGNGFNPRKCNSTSSLGVCIEWDLSEVIITLPFNKTIMEIFEKTITGGLTIVTTRLGSDTEILMLNYTAAEYDKISIDESFLTSNKI